MSTTSPPFTISAPVSGTFIGNKSSCRTKSEDRLVAIANWLFSLQPINGDRTIPGKSIQVVCISDTHNVQPQLPPGDLLLHAGDMSESGSFGELQDQLDWLDRQSHRYKVVIAGNHDLLLDTNFCDQFPERVRDSPEQQRSDLKWGSLLYLQDSSTTLSFQNGRQLKIYGTPHTPQYGNWAFQYPPIRNIYAKAPIPDDTDILITHGPPKHHLDTRYAKGCKHLRKELWRVSGHIQLAVFGHIHAGFGSKVVAWSTAQRLYEDILTGEGGCVALCGLFLCIIGQALVRLLGVDLVASHKPNKTVLVNAAVKPSVEGGAVKPAIVVTV